MTQKKSPSEDWKRHVIIGEERPHAHDALRHATRHIKAGPATHRSPEAVIAPKEIVRFIRKVAPGVLGEEPYLLEVFARIRLDGESYGTVAKSISLDAGRKVTSREVKVLEERATQRMRHFLKAML